MPTEFGRLAWGSLFLLLAEVVRPAVLGAIVSPVPIYVHTQPSLRPPPQLAMMHRPYTQRSMPRAREKRSPRTCTLDRWTSPLSADAVISLPCLVLLFRKEPLWRTTDSDTDRGSGGPGAAYLTSRYSRLLLINTGGEGAKLSLLRHCMCIPCGAHTWSSASIGRYCAG